jgi:hypothetical protein
MKNKWIVKNHPYIITDSVPSAIDKDYSVDFIWINRVTNIAYVFMGSVDGSGVWAQKSPDTILGDDIYIIGETSSGDIVRASDTITVVTSDGITSTPGVGQKRVTNIVIGTDDRLVATYDE